MMLRRSDEDPDEADPDPEDPELPEPPASPASPRNALGTWDIDCWALDTTFCAWLAGDAAAWATAAAWLPVASGLVFCRGGVNGVTVEAVAESAA